ELYITNELKWSFDLEYAFYRDTLTCLMNRYNLLDEYFNFIQSRTLDTVQKEMLSNILNGFINMNLSHWALQLLQLILLIANVIVVCLNLTIVFYRWIMMYKKGPEKKIFP